VLLSLCVHPTVGSGQRLAARWADRESTAGINGTVMIAWALRRETHHIDSSLQPQSPIATSPWDRRL
jgi:hypothetical protein